jgi:hypothetical protein
MLDQRRYRPMSVIDLFDEAFDLYKRRFGLIFGAIGLVYIPLYAIVTAYFSQYAHNWIVNSYDEASQSGLTQIFPLLNEVFGRLVVVYPIDLIGYALIFGVGVAIVAGDYENRPETLPSAFRTVFRRLLALIGSLGLASLLIALLCAVSVATFIIVIGIGLAVFTVFIALRLVFVPAVAMAEPNVGIWAIVKRSRELASGFEGRILGCLSLSFLLVGIVYVALQIPLDLLSQKMVDWTLPFVPMLAAHQEVTSQIDAAVAGLVVLPFFVILMTLMYYDLRVRKEGFDMELAARSLGYAPVPYKPAIRAAFNTSIGANPKPRHLGTKR